MSNLSEEDRIALARAVMAILSEWKVSAADQGVILGFPEGTPGRKMRRYHEDTPLPDDPKIMERVEHVISINNALSTTYPTSRNMQSIWMHRPIRRLRYRKPVNIMVEDGLNGIVRVRSHLDCAYMWDANAAKSH